MPPELLTVPPNVLRVSQRQRTAGLAPRGDSTLTPYPPGVCAQDFLGHFTRAVVEDVAPGVSDEKVEAAFSGVYSSLAGAGLQPARPLDLRVDFRHICRWASPLSAYSSAHAAAGCQVPACRVPPQGMRRHAGRPLPDRASTMGRLGYGSKCEIALQR